jgi:hypothetical protein
MNLIIQNVIGIAAIVALLSFAWVTLKRSKADTLVTITKETENGETLCFNTNFSSDASDEEKQDKVDALIGIAEKRMFAAQQKMVAAMEQARQEQKLKKVT